MSRRSVQIAIDALVVQGIAPADREAYRVAVERELSTLLMSDGIQASTDRVSSERQVRAIGAEPAQIARAVYAAICQ